MIQLRSRLWTVTILVVCLAAAGAFAAMNTRRDQGLTPEVIEIAQPKERVAFSANVTKTYPKVGRIFSGRFYRDTDGSTREDGILRYGDKADEIVAIANFSARAIYVYRPQDGWSSTDLEVGPEPLVRHRVARPGVTGLLPDREPWAGLRVYRRILANGDLELVAPDLNFFPVMMQGGVSGERVEYSNIKVGPVARELFHPPSDAAVRHRGPTPMPKRPYK